jgi:hypothetical protein
MIKIFISNNHVELESTGNAWTQQNPVTIRTIAAATRSDGTLMLFVNFEASKEEEDEKIPKKSRLKSLMSRAK